MLEPSTHLMVNSAENLNELSKVWIRRVLVSACIVFTAVFLNVSGISEEFEKKLEMPSWTTEDFYQAIEKNDEIQIREFLSDTPRATREFLSFFLLDYALELERNYIAHLMVEAGAGTSTLPAVQHDNLSIVEELLKRGAEPKGVSLAAERGNAYMVKLLLDYGETEISTVGAAKNGQLETLNLLLDAGADPRGLGDAVLRGHNDVVKLLLDSGADPNELTRMFNRELLGKYNWTFLAPLHCAVISKSVDLVQVLLDHGADPNIAPSSGVFAFDERESKRYWRSVLSIATDPELGDEEIAKLLEANGARNVSVSDFNNMGRKRSLYEAADKWNYDRVMELLKAGAKPEGFGSFYYDYSDSYDPRIMQAFVEAGADPGVYTTFDYHYNPTAMTLMQGDVENFKRFIEAGGSLGPTYWYMKIACVQGLTDAIEHLWMLETPTPSYSAELVIGTNYGHVHMVEFLLARGARPTTLRRAVSSENLEIVKMLLEAGADPNLPDRFDERSALELAQETKNEEIIGMLKEAGARP